ncbi:MAG: 1,2-phenylacetyl-CoA epoxidase subunit PaaD [Alphaproteobacteria bacterium]|nr:1,2-phenylacetyl-CoA epoxidase subunit PaaD [Alphaproteobacteria bacterium]
MVQVSANHNLPEIDTIWAWLDNVPDPEVPVVSVVDLGIVRDVHWEENELCVTVTPTYSGCPATAVIALDIETALLKQGIDKVRVETKLTPAWTTAWLSAKGREKLEAFGIAPPQDDVGKAGAGACGIGKADLSPPEAMHCPKCKSSNTRCVSWFGSTPCKAAYQCNDCLEPFDYFKCI